MASHIPSQPSVSPAPVFAASEPAAAEETAGVLNAHAKV
jgi:hypothetical protein